MKRLPLLVLVALGVVSPAQSQDVDPARLAEALERYTYEPSVDALLEHVDDDDAFDPEAVRRLVRRARRGGWLLGARKAFRREVPPEG